MNKTEYLLQWKDDDYCYCEFSIQAYSLDDAQLQAKAYFESGELNQTNFLVSITEEPHESY